MEAKIALILVLRKGTEPPIVECYTIARGSNAIGRLASALKTPEIARVCRLSHGLPVPVEPFTDAYLEPAPTPHYPMDRINGVFVGYDTRVDFVIAANGLKKHIADGMTVEAFVTATG